MDGKLQPRSRKDGLGFILTELHAAQHLVECVSMAAVGLIDAKESNALIHVTAIAQGNLVKAAEMTALLLREEQK